MAPRPDPSLDAYERAPARLRLGIGAAIVLVLVALGATVAVGVVRGASAPVEVVAPEAGESDALADVVYVHVEGAVRAPGLYRLDVDARVVDAVAAAGGFAEDADTGGVNLARPVTDGEQLRVPQIGEGADAAGGGGGGVEATGPTSSGLVSLNSASAEQLDTLPRVGPAIAQRIIEWREQNGGFRRVDDLAEVPGIGDKMLESLRPLVGL